MTNGTNKAVEFAHNVDLSQRIGQLSEALKKETREDRRNELQSQIDNLVYNVLVQNRENLNIDEEFFSRVSATELRENPQHQNLYKTGQGYTSQLPLERSNMMLGQDLENILTGIPEKYVDEIAISKELNEALGDDNLVREYSDVVKEAIKYKAFEAVARKYKEGGELEDKEKQFYFSNLADSLGKNFKDKLKDSGFSEDMQNLGGNLASLAAAAGAVKRDVVEKSADEELKNAEQKFRDYETKRGKKLVDYARQGVGKLISEKDTEKYNIGRGLVYSAAKTYVSDEKLEAKDEDFYRLLAA